MAEHHNARDRGGKFARTPDTAERDAEAARLRTRGLTYRAIAEQMGYASPSSVHDAVKRCLDAIVEEPGQEVRRLELERLDDMYAAVMAVLEREHITISQGRIVRKRVLDENGDPTIVATDRDGKPVFREEEILDDAPVLAAVDRLLKIMERRAKLTGLDAPVKADIGGTLKYEVLGVDLSAPKRTI